MREISHTAQGAPNMKMIAKSGTRTSPLSITVVLHL
jgi:hypothetical protein